jgi:hypothetical protein
MSGKIMGQVWDLDLPHNKLIVLLAMTDHADHEGNNIFPSMELIAWKTGYSERQVRRIVQSLEKDKLLTKTSRPGYTNMYAVNLSAGKQKAPFTSVKITPDKMSYPVQKEGITPDIAMSDQIGHLDVLPTPDIQMSYEPSLEPSINHIADGKVIPMPTMENKLSKTDGMYEAVKDVFGHEGGMNKDFQKMLVGTATKAQHKPYNMPQDNPVTPDELRAWAKWYRRVELNGNQSLTMVQSPAKVQSSLLKYRGLQQQKQNAVPIQSGLTEAELHNLWMITGQRNEAS